MKVGIQLFSVRNQMMKDPAEAIRQVSKKGYRYLEVANHNAQQDFGVGFPVSPNEIKQVLAETGASIVSAHIFPLTMETIHPVVEYHQQIGTKFLAVPMDFYVTGREVRHKAEAMNKVAQVCKQAGMELVYHNHFHEFQVLAGEQKSVYQLLMEHTDSDLVKIEIDTYWAMRAGVDPVDFIKEYGKRVRLIHQKDYPKGRSSEMNLLAKLPSPDTSIDMDYFQTVVDPTAFTEIGTGMMDIQGIINAANEYGQVDYIILEQDSSTLDEMDSIALSKANFEKYQGLEW